MSGLERSEPATGPIAEPALIHRVELAISFILRGGVVISIVLVTFGCCLTFFNNPELVTKSYSLSKMPEAFPDAFPRTLGETWGSVCAMRGQGFVILGLLVLLMTPVVRVAASIVAFTIQRDWIFVAITAVVLGILILSFVLGKAEGGG